MVKKQWIIIVLSPLLQKSDLRLEIPIVHEKHSFKTDRSICATPLLKSFKIDQPVASRTKSDVTHQELVG